MCSGQLLEALLRTKSSILRTNCQNFIIVLLFNFLLFQTLKFIQFKKPNFIIMKKILLLILCIYNLELCVALCLQML